tara:strand:+ start:3072 stop:3491 length:420 start_codon:yes stop_codon:yes gene_type:complete
MFSIDEIFTQAQEDSHSIKINMLNGESVVNNGVKIQKFPSKIELLNCGRSGDYFQEFNQEEYNLFYRYGWREGGLRLSMMNCKRKLDLIEEKIRNEVNTRKNDKHIQRLKTSREKLLIKYSNKNVKLNKLKSNGKEKHL